MEQRSHSIPDDAVDANERIQMNADGDGGYEIPSSTVSFAALRSARAWNRILTMVTLGLAATTMVSLVYIAKNNNDSPALVTPSGSTVIDSHNRTSAGGTISAKLNNATLPHWKPLPDPSQVLTKIAFGSCNSHEMPQPHWDTLTQLYQPDLFIMAGDNVYGDCDNATSCFHLRETYRKMALHASVQGAAPLLSVLATLDDHDYGMNDCSGSNPHKELARELFAEFFCIPWSELAGKDGVYQAHIFGPPNQRLQVIVLDTRYMRSPMNKTSHSWIDPVIDITQLPVHYENGTVDTEGAKYMWQMLSEKQWQWFEDQLAQSADVRLVVSSIQVLTTSSHYEAWKQLPLEQERLFRITKNKSVIFLSGDIHMGALYEDGPLIEVTSSSLTHTQPLGVEFFQKHCATADACEIPDYRRVGEHFIYENNFGSVDIDWTQRTVQVGLRRTETAKGSNYLNATPSILYGNAGDLLISRTYSFPF